MNQEKISKLKVILKAGFLISILFAVNRCDIGEVAGPASGTFSNVYKNTLSKGVSCKNCHVPGGDATVNGARIDFSTQDTAYSTLTSSKVLGATSTGNCGTLNIIQASTPSQSYLVGVLFTDYQTSNFGSATGCTPITTHTAGYTNLSESEKTSIMTWIQNGAKND